MNPDPQNTPDVPQGEAPAGPPVPASDAFATPATTPIAPQSETAAAGPNPVVPPAPAVSPAPFSSSPLAQPVTAPEQSTAPIAPAEQPASPAQPAPPAPNPFVQPPAQPDIAPGVPFGDPAQPTPPASSPDALPVAAPETSHGTATLALIFGGIGLIAWLLPIVGLPVAIVALVFAIKSLKRGQKYAKLALGLAIASLIATLVNAGVGAYMGYTAAQKAASDSSQTSSEAETLNTVPYPEESRTAFVESCVTNGGTETACTCTLNEIEKQLTFEEFSAVDKEIAETGNIPDSFREIQDNAIATCTE